MGPLGQDHETINIVGSWTAFKKCQEMTFNREAGSYSCYIRLGDSRFERFQICAGGSRACMIYPVINTGSMKTRVMGPDEHGSDRYWMIDGRDDEVCAGTGYQVTFRWGHSVSWE